MPVRWHLLGLVRGDPLLAAGGELAELVELGVVAGADEAAVAGHERAVVDERRVRAWPRTSGQRSSRASSSREQRALAAGELGLHLRQDGERAADEAQIARAGPAGGDAGEQPLDVVDSAQLLAQVVASERRRRRAPRRRRAARRSRRRRSAARRANRRAAARPSA